MSGPGIKQHGESKNLDLEDLATLPAKAALGQFGYSVPANRPVVNTSTNVNSPNFKALAYLEDLVSPVNGVDGLSLLSGTSNPSAAQGKNGDKYLNYASLDVFEKINGAWELKVNIKGEDGSSGINSTVDFQWGVIGIMSGTSIITSKNTVPLVTEGSEIWRKSITGKKNGNRLTIRFTAHCDCIRRNTLMYFVLFRDDVALDVFPITSGNNSAGSPMPVMCEHISNLTDMSSHTYTMRFGVAVATTWYLNRSLNNTYGSITEGYWSIREEQT